jgi:murein hydrolase activator
MVGETPANLIRAAALGASLCAFMSMISLHTAAAETAPPAKTPLPSKTEQRTASATELDDLLRATSLSQQRVKELDAEIAGLKKDETSVTAALIQSSKTSRKLTEDIARIEDRLAEQRGEEAGIRTSLHARRSVLAEVLAALQRIGLNPPPAILVKPEDALSSVRSAILLSAVVPEMRVETERLVADLDALKRVTTSIANERNSLLQVLKAQTEERHRLDALVAQKQELRAQSEASRTAESQKITDLAGKAKTLKDLIAALEKDMATEQNAQERARREEEKRLALEKQKADSEASQTAMLAPGMSIEKLRKTLVLPISGKIIRRFGQDDGFGGKTAGIALAAGPQSIVATPVDATVLYAGPFRSYHQLLILDAGGGYHVVMGGMDKSMVTTGQFVLSGEPVGVMATKAPGSSGQTHLTDSQELYIEFRKDGKPVDSGPWWSADTTGRAGNAT